MRGIELNSPDGIYAAYLSGKGRRLLFAGGQFDRDTYPPQISPPFEATGLRCRTCYRETTDMPQVLHLLADRLKRKQLRLSYHRRCLARRRRSQ